MWGVRVPVLVGGCSAAPCAATASYNQSQPPPKDTQQDTVEPIGHADGASVKAYLRKGKKRLEEGTAEQQIEHQGQRRRRRRCHFNWH